MVQIFFYRFSGEKKSPHHHNARVLTTVSGCHGVARVWLIGPNEERQALKGIFQFNS